MLFAVGDSIIRGSSVADNLPYLPAPGSIKGALEKIRDASVPERVSFDFVSTKLLIKGGTGKAVLALLKKIGMVTQDGIPTDLYKQFRNRNSGGAALATAIKRSYSALASVNEYFYLLKDSDLKNLIIQVSGLDKDNKIIGLMFSTLQNLKAYANFEAKVPDEPEIEPIALPVNFPDGGAVRGERPIGLNL